MPESRDELKQRLARVIRRQWSDDRVSTHYIDCWENHRACAALFAAALLDPEPPKADG